MQKVKRTLMVAIFIATMVPGAVHPNGETPPILQEIEFLKSELKADISRLERRITEHSDLLSALDDESIEELVQRLIYESPISNSVSNVVQDVEKLKIDVASIVSSDRSVVRDWIYPGIMGFLGGVLAWLLGKILKAISNSRAKRKS